jgi:hypothetical protein
VLGVPVGDDEPLEAELGFEDAVQKFAVLTAVGVVRPDMLNSVRMWEG